MHVWDNEKTSYSPTGLWIFVVVYASVIWGEPGHDSCILLHILSQLLYALHSFHTCSVWRPFLVTAVIVMDSYGFSLSCQAFTAVFAYCLIAYFKNWSTDKAGSQWIPDEKIEGGRIMRNLADDMVVGNRCARNIQQQVWCHMVSLAVSRAVCLLSLEQPSFCQGQRVAISALCCAAASAAGAASGWVGKHRFVCLRFTLFSKIYCMLCWISY